MIKTDRAEPLPLRLLSDEGVFVVYDAALPWIERDARARYVGWWLGATDEQVYVYPALLYNSHDAVGALIDLAEQFALDLDPLTEGVPEMAKRVVRELEQRAGDPSREPRRAGDRSIRTATARERSASPLHQGGAPSEAGR
jgi:hypothetical protein